MDELTRLFLAARDGDRTALLHAVRASQADVWRLAYHLVGPDDADDVTQDAFVRAWKALPAFRARLERPHVAPLHRPARLRRPGAARRATTPVAAQRLEHEADPAPARRPAPSIRATRTRCRRSSTSCPTDQREAFVLTQVIGCSYAEAAEACGVPIGTIRSRVARAREQLVEQVRRSETG